MNNDAKINCLDCGGTGKRVVKTSMGRQWRQHCPVCRGRKVRKPLYNVCNAANGDAYLLPKKKARLQDAEEALELFVSRGYDRNSLFIKQC